jgi:2-polyprenyl-3-methyl-5-hydroxy-6-metoxy-1,4-benzoquinol methylase
MSIKRTHKLSQKKWLKENSHLKILDLGCTHVNYWPEANNFADIEDYSEYFSKKNLAYTKIEPNKKLPFKDKEFDYVILSHVMEHVPNLLEFKDELVRIAKRGYIELPTKMYDNLVFGCDEEILGHKWWFEFDDDRNILKYTAKVNALEKFLSVGSSWKFQKFFEDSFLLQFYWEDSFKLEEMPAYNVEKKISFLQLIKKYFSKKIRDVIRS